MRFCVIGPAHPFRGGIAQHTTLLCRHLSDRHDVQAVTYKRLYPSILFPGKSQVDHSRKSVSFDAEPIIDSVSPLTWIKAGNRIREMQPDIVLVEWWHPFFAPCLASAVSRSRPAKSIFICHNVLPHEPGALVKPMTLWALRHGDGFIVHSRDQEQILKEILPGRPVARTILPEFSVVPRLGITKSNARKELGIEGRTILFFGLVRKYKGLIDLIRAMSHLKGEKITCLVVGEFYDKKDEYVSEISRLGLTDSMRIVDEYIPNERVETYFAASDVVVLPYRSATQSAVVQVAYQFERPVIASTVGGLPEVVDDGRTGLLVPPEDPEALAEAIRAYFRESMESRCISAIRSDEGRFSWDRVVETIETLGASL